MNEKGKNVYGIVAIRKQLLFLHLLQVSYFDYK